MSGATKRPAGPPTAGGPAFLVVGKVRRPHGVHGKVVAEIYTDFPERLSPKKAIYLGEKHTRLVITNQRPHNEGLLLGFEGVTTPDQAGRYRNQILSIAAVETSKLPEGEFYFHELLDLEVVDEAGNLLGTLTDILETGANDVYMVTGSSGRELLLPAISEVVLDVDLDKKTMKVHLLPGLVDEEGENRKQ
ncbi:MAG TPA: ribosome maturation factor RimM [Anaerolineales bacterium]